MSREKIAFTVIGDSYVGFLFSDVLHCYQLRDIKKLNDKPIYDISPFISQKSSEFNKCLAFDKFYIGIHDINGIKNVNLIPIPNKKTLFSHLFFIDKKLYPLISINRISHS